MKVLLHTLGIYCINIIFNNGSTEDVCCIAENEGEALNLAKKEIDKIISWAEEIYGKDCCDRIDINRIYHINKGVINSKQLDSDFIDMRDKHFWDLF